jgi:uncharacterized membrane protein
MTQLYRCRSCGFVMTESALKDACPACGVPRKMFEPYSDPVSDRRRFVLGLDIHPIVVHFAVAFAISACAVSLFTLAFPAIFRQTLTGALRTVVAVQPLVIIVSYFTGRYDARVRFRKAKSSYLGLKKTAGILFFVLSAASAALLFGVGPFVPWVRAVDAVMLTAAAGCSFVLGRIGGRLMSTLFPG